MLLKEKIALVTGSTNNIGLAIARAFAREGAKVIVTPQPHANELQQRNRMALVALDRFLAEPDDLPPEKWLELEKIIEEHPIRIRKNTLA